jgi:hypothetical protein
MQVKNVGDGGVIGCIMLHFKPCALIRGSAENSQLSMTQFQIREGTDINQSQGLIILANIWKPKCTISSVVIP